MLREQGQGALAGRIEQALRGQFRLQLLERLLQAALARFLRLLNHNLVLAGFVIDGQVAEYPHLDPVANGHLDTALTSLEEHGRDLRVFVLEGKIHVTGRRRAQIGDFALDPNRADPVFEQHADQPRQLGHLVNFPLPVCHTF
ncbi:MAG: hypothetical protein BWY59_01604 [Verrucomicrobia bacterium ADurb.Bin345]|nr:MAG: hypothetical protein BWY59_01604 [Verrucomicrobia bacterium ADurb.Bin345]